MTNVGSFRLLRPILTAGGLLRNTLHLGAVHFIMGADTRTSVLSAPAPAKRYAQP